MCIRDSVSLAAPRVAALVGEFPRSPAFRGLAEGLRTLIAEGRVPVGVRLPSERDLTEAVGVSRTTVTRAYDVLRDEGYLESRQGSGSVTRLPVSRAGRTDHLLMVRDGRARTRSTSRSPPRWHLRARPPPSSAPSSGSRRTSPAAATTPQECPRCARRSPAGTPHAGCPPTPSS